MIPAEYEPIYTAGYQKGFSEGLHSGLMLPQDTGNCNTLRVFYVVAISVLMAFTGYLIIKVCFL